MNQDTVKRQMPRWLKIVIGSGVTAGLVVAAMYMFVFFLFYSFHDLPLLLRPLPSDEEMIANFRRHRADFKQLVRIYREDLSVPTDVVGTLEPTPEIKAIMDRINVDVVKGDGMVWMPPNPYCHDSGFTKRIMKFHQLPQQRRFSGVKFGYARGAVIGMQFNLFCKDYYYVPLIPRIRGGLLLTPFTPGWGYSHVVNSLSTYPPKFSQFDCFCRQIEPQWFIEMCRKQ